MDPLDLWSDDAAVEALPLPPPLATLYGPPRMRSHADRPHAFTNFVPSVDGVVALDPPRGTGGDISWRWQAGADRPVPGSQRSDACCWSPRTARSTEV